MQGACEFGESRDAKANRLSDEIHANRSEITRAGRRPQAIGADAVCGTDPAGEFFKSQRAVVAERPDRRILNFIDPTAEVRIGLLLLRLLAAAAVAL